MIVENKTHGLGAETNFEFKYIPNFDTATRQGEYEVSGIKEPGIERRNLKALVFASVFVGVISYVGTRTTFGLLRRLGVWFTGC